MRAALTIAICVVACAGCNPARGCLDTCHMAQDEDCALDGMEACETLCGGLSEDAETAGCTEAWLDLEFCLGMDPVCAAHSRCATERGLYNTCLDDFCEDQPEACNR